MYMYLKNHCFPLVGAYFVQKTNSSRVNLAQAESQIRASPRASQETDFPPLLLAEGITSEKQITA